MFWVVSRTWGRIAILSVVVLICMGCAALLRGRGLADEWPTYGNDPGGTRYSPLTQIDRANVASLRVAWTYRTGERGGAPPYAHVAFEATPLMRGRDAVSQHAVQPRDRTRRARRAPSAGRGMPKVDPSRRLAIVTSRGVSAWLDGAASRSAACRRRIFVGTIDARLIALDAGSGTPCGGLRARGKVDLKEGIKVI